MRKWLFVALLVISSSAMAADVGKPMPPVPAAASLLAGQPPLDWRAFRGKVLYVDFWASWCVPCRASMPALEGLYQRFASRGFVVVGVNKDDRRTDAERFLQKYPATFPLASDTDDKVVRAFEVPAMPSGYLIDRRGVVRRVHQGFTAETAASLEREVEALLKEGA